MIRKKYIFSYLLEKIKQDLKFRDIDLAEYLDVTPATISNWLNSNALPRGKNVTRIPKILFRELEMSNIINTKYCKGLIEGLMENYSLPESRTVKIDRLICEKKYREAFINIFSLINEEDANNKVSNNIIENAKSPNCYAVNDYCQSVVESYDNGKIEILAEYVAKILQNNYISPENSFEKMEPLVFTGYVM